MALVRRLDSIQRWRDIFEHTKDFSEISNAESQKITNDLRSSAEQTEHHEFDDVNGKNGIMQMSLSCGIFASEKRIEIFNLPRTDSPIDTPVESE